MFADFENMIKEKLGSKKSNPKTSTVPQKIPRTSLEPLKNTK